MAYLEGDGVSIHYTVSGREYGEAVVLAHSLGQDLHLFDSQVEALGERYRVIRYDARGHGRSSIPQPPVTIAHMGHDPVRLLDVLGVEKAYFCGVSIGGLVGQWLGVHAPHRFRKLVLSNTAARIGTEEAWKARIRLMHDGGMEALVPGSAERWLRPDFRAAHPEMAPRFEQTLLNTPPEGYKGGCHILAETDLRPEISNITVPVLCIGGKHDPTTPPDQTRWIAEQAQNGRYVELDAAHLSNVDTASVWNRLVLDFFAA